MVFGPLAGAITGSGLGFLSGLTSSRGYAGKPFEQMLDAETRKKYGQGGVARLEGWASGQQPITSQATINRLMSGQLGRLDAAAGSARTRATERAIQRGEGSRSGMLDKRLAEIDRSLIDAKRQQAAPLMGQLAMAEPQFRMQSMGMMLPFLQGQEELGAQDWARLEDLRAGRAAAGSALHRGFAGAAAGSGGFMNMGRG